MKTATLHGRPDVEPDVDDFDDGEWFESVERQAYDEATEAKLERMAERAMAAFGEG